VSAAGLAKRPCGSVVGRLLDSFQRNLRQSRRSKARWPLGDDSKSLEVTVAQVRFITGASHACEVFPQPLPRPTGGEVRHFNVKRSAASLVRHRKCTSFLLDRDAQQRAE